MSNFVAVGTIGEDYQTVRNINATDASVPARTTSATRPSGIGDNVAQATASGVFDLRGGAASGGVGPTRIKVVPFGVGSDTNTFTMRVYGWRKAFRRGDGREPTKDIWVATNLGEFTCTLSTPAGIAGKHIIATELFCDSLAYVVPVTATDNKSVEVVDADNNTPAHCAIDIKGEELLEIVFGTGSSATSCNALVAKY